MEKRFSFESGASHEPEPDPVVPKPDPLAIEGLLKALQEQRGTVPEKEDADPPELLDMGAGMEVHPEADMGDIARRFRRQGDLEAAG